jgi:uncharacterized protein
MTPQETQLLNDLIRRVKETPLTEKDPEAEQLLRDGLGSQPDAIYILAQTALVQNIALQQAGAQIEQLKQQFQQAQQQAQQVQQRPARATSFLGSLLGHHEESQQNPPSSIPQQQRPGFTGQPQYQQQPQYQPVAVPAGGYAPQPVAPPMPSGGGSSFLRSAATTAAGVAAGALAFEGIEALFHGMSHPSGLGYGSGFGGFGSPAGMGGFGNAPVEETIVNNYYDSDSNREHHEHEASYDERPDGHEQLDRSEYEPNSSAAHLENASYDPGGDNTLQDQDLHDDSDLQADDDNNYDDSGSDDFSDDGGDFSGGDDSSLV